MTDRGNETSGPEGVEPQNAADAKAAKAKAAAEARAQKAAEEAAKPAWERDPATPETVPADDDPLVRALRAGQPDAVSAAASTDGELTLEIASESIESTCRALRDEHGFALLVDICGVDYPERGTERFEVVYHLYNLEANRRVRLRVRVAEDTEVPTVTSVWRGANWCEREIYDMYGLRFASHPDMTRILMWEGFNGHPLRKDFPVQGIDTGSAIYPELYDEEAGPVTGTGTGWRPPAEDRAAGSKEEDTEPSS